MKKEKKPIAQLTGQNGNVFNLIAICCIALKRVGKRAEAESLQKECFRAESYEAALAIMGKYVDIR